MIRFVVIHHNPFNRFFFVRNIVLFISAKGDDRSDNRGTVGRIPFRFRFRGGISDAVQYVIFQIDPDGGAYTGPVIADVRAR